MLHDRSLKPITVPGSLKYHKITNFGNFFREPGIGELTRHGGGGGGGNRGDGEVSGRRRRHRRLTHLRVGRSHEHGTMSRVLLNLHSRHFIF